MLRVGRAVLSERTRQRRALLIQVVLRLFAVELDQHVTGVHAIAEIVKDAADDPVGFRRDGDLVDRGQGADHFNRTDHGLFAHGFDLHRLGGVVAAASLGTLAFGTA